MPPLEALPALEGMAVSPDRFGLETHDQIVELVSTNPASKACSEKLVQAQWRQDTLHQFESKAHFDNCDFDGAISYVHELDGLAAQAAAAADWDGVLVNLGQALHALQDFYAHSNYVEMMSSRHSPPENTPIVRFWEADSKVKVAPLRDAGLVSGRVWWGFPKLCGAGSPTHGAMAKDSASHGHGVDKIPGSETTHYELARKLAARTTRAYLSFTFSRWPGLAAHCGEGIGFVVGLDRRQVD